MTVRERALELLHQVSGLLEQLVGEVEEAEGDAAEPSRVVDPAPTSEAVPAPECSQGGDHVEVRIHGSTYCELCNTLLDMEERECP